MKRRNLFIIIGAGVFLFTGCNLLPVEEELRTAPIVSSYKAEEYDYVLVERGDLQLTENISCAYQSTQSESLAFAIGGEYYGTIYAKVGDKVKKGDLLAELMLDEITDKIRDSEDTISKLELQLQYMNERITIEQNKLKLDENNSTIIQAVDRYISQRKQYEDSIYIAKERLKEYLSQKEQRQIYAGMDGVVSYIKSVKKGEKSIEDKRFITIIDPSLSFIAHVKEPEFFPIGMKADIIISKEIYTTTVTEVIEEKENTYTVVFALDQPSVSLEQGARGNYTLVREERKNALFLPENAIINSSNGNIVYGFDEKGFKAIKPVQVGILAAGNYEIISGLNEGEMVILE